MYLKRLVIAKRTMDVFFGITVLPIYWALFEVLSNMLL